jgi:hypothetical protein
MRYLHEVAKSVSEINGSDSGQVLKRLQELAVSRTREADVKLDAHGKPVEEEPLDLGDDVLIIEPPRPAS